jgi:hypothetical protein
LKTPTENATVATDELALAAGRVNDELRTAENDLLIEQYARQLEDAATQASQLATAADNFNTAMGNLTTEGISGYTDALGEQIRLQALLDLWQGNIFPETYNQILANSFLIGNMETLNSLLAEGTITMPTWLAYMADGVVTNEELAKAQDTTNDTIFTGAGYMHDYDEAAQGATTSTYLYRDALNAIDGKIVNVTINEHRNVGTPGEYVGFQHGANFVVPPGYNENYPIGYASSGERVIVIPKSGETGNITNNYFNQNVHTNAKSSTVIGDFNVMRAMAG